MSQFVAYYVKQNKVVAVARYCALFEPPLTFADLYILSMQRDPVVSKASELLRLGLMPSPSELKAGKVSLSDLPFRIVG